MLLRNYYNQFTSQMTYKTIANGLKDTDGVVRNSCMPSTATNQSNMCGTLAFNYISGVDSAYKNRYICVGSGNTPATADDYKLENLITTVKGSNTTKSMDDDGNYVVVANITNNGTTQIVVNEVGIAFNCFYDTSNTVVCLLERTVLDKPLTLGAGESGFISYKVRLGDAVGSFPTA